MYIREGAIGDTGRSEEHHLTELPVGNQSTARNDDEARRTDDGPLPFNWEKWYFFFFWRACRKIDAVQYSTVQYSIVKGIMTLDQSALDEYNAGAIAVPSLTVTCDSGAFSGMAVLRLRLRRHNARGVKSNEQVRPCDIIAVLQIFNRIFGHFGAALSVRTPDGRFRGGRILNPE
jgi:hypothetical protein